MGAGMEENWAVLVREGQSLAVDGFSSLNMAIGNTSSGGKAYYD